MDIVQRAKAMVLSPATEWPIIEKESGDASYLFTNYAAALAAIPPVFLFLRSVFGGGGFASSLFGGVIHWIAALVFALVLAIVIEALAPTFGVAKNRENALKLVVYAMTPLWLAGVIALLPGFGFVRLAAAVYSIYVFWLGVPLLLRTTGDRAPRYAAVVVLCGFALWAVMSALVGTFV